MESHRIRLKIDCPNFRKCSELGIEWVREACRHPTYIDQDGNLSCEKWCRNPNLRYFIQEARFKCAEAGEYYQWTDKGTLCAELGSIITAMAGTTSEFDLMFCFNLVINIKQKWK